MDFVLPVPLFDVQQDEFLAATGANKPDNRKRRSSWASLDECDGNPNEYKKKVDGVSFDQFDGNCNENQKKIMHRDAERHRRRKMATLFGSLRSLLPPEHVKGKRSTSDHMHEATIYIRHLQKRIEGLNGKREDLREALLVTSDGSPSSQRCNVTVRTCRVGVEVVVSTPTITKRGLPPSSLLSVLHEEGLDTVSCISCKVNERLLHTIEAKVRCLVSPFA
ncbi:hypothetical protein RJ639_002393 [Escallonia herrerae]|uniref:BHLH domain-containing protein n=1 Tax=Escallonia herrerae TaxID=1293975 RepID=A0AA89BMR5_9ASTE|nr:hypothetical protein RJ639_002393 [Escallonia herrerae]